jgi:hypothetical protein
MEEQKAMQAFVDHMLRHTVNLVRVVPNQWPVGIASGFIIPVEKWYRIISAGHAIAAKPNWAIETVPVSATETLMLTVKNVRALATISPGEPTNALDLAWADLFPDELRSQLAEAPKKPAVALELPLYQGPLDTVPDSDTPYGFAAWNYVEPHEVIGKLVREPRYELNLRYVGIHPSNGLYQFEPARPFRGHEYYKGASGAPIADPTGLIVSMLVGGHKEENCLWGIPLAAHAMKLMAV